MWQLEKIAEYMGGTPALIETEVESAFINKMGLKTAGFHYNSSEGTHYYYALLELPDNIFIEKITLAKDSVSIDSSVTYQLVPQIYPSTASFMPVRYFSSNEAVATVDENGLVTPVSTGTATIYVFSEDMQVSDYIEINVKDEVKAISIIAPEKMQINIGETAALGAYLKPSNTTKALSYVSSDESVVRVDAEGKITAVSKGEATVTTSVSNGDEVITAETLVSVVVPVESVEFELGMVYIKPGETKAVAPVITPANATSKNLIWDSSNPDICYVNENGELVGAAEGMATLKATVENTGLSAYIIVCVSETFEGSVVVDMDYLDYSNNALNYAVTDDGSLWYWGWDWDENVIKFPKKLDVTCSGESISVAQFAMARTNNNGYYTYLILDTDGNLYATSSLSYASNLHEGTNKDSFKLIKENAVKLISNDRNEAFAIAILEDGTVLTLGHNYSGAMGIGGSGQCIEEPVMVAIDGERIVDGFAGHNYSYLLTEGGKLYFAGASQYEYYTKIYEGVDYLQNGIAVVGDKYFNLDGTTSPTLSTLTGENRGYNNGSNNDSFYTDNGRAYVSGSLIPELTNVVKIFYNYSGGWFYLTENNELYNQKSYSSTVVPTLVPFGAELIKAAPALREGDTNLTDVVSGEGSLTGILTDDTLQLGFDASIYNGTNYHNILANVVIMKPKNMRGITEK